MTPAVLYRRLDTTITTASFESAGRQYPVTELATIWKVVVDGGWWERILELLLWLFGWKRSRMFELWGQFQGRTVRLFHCDDEREFGQVCRALVRAREHAGLA